MKGWKPYQEELFFEEGRVVSIKKNKEDLFLENEIVSDEVRKVLMSNPFTYHHQETAFVVDSIEDFYITIQHCKMKKDVALGAIVRNYDIPRHLKKTFVKKAFKNWKKDFYNQFATHQEETKTNIAFNFKKKDYQKKTIYKLLPFMQVIIYFLFAVIIFYVFQKKDNWFNDLSSKIFDNHAIKIVWVFGFSVAVFTIYLLFGLTCELRRCSNAINKTTQLLGTTERQFKQLFRKNYRQARKYYLNHIAKKDIYFPPYNITMVGFEKITFTNISSITLETRKLMYKFTNYWPKTNRVFIVCFYLNWLIIVGIFLFGILVALI